MASGNRSVVSEAVRTAVNGSAEQPSYGFAGLSLIALVRAYQYGISPFLPPACRFYPSCSEYMVQSIAQHGAFRGLALGIVRLSKCRPGHPGGIDPVPENRRRGLFISDH